MKLFKKHLNWSYGLAIVVSLAITFLAFVN